MMTQRTVSDIAISEVVYVPPSALIYEGATQLSVRLDSTVYEIPSPKAPIRLERTPGGYKVRAVRTAIVIPASARAVSSDQYEAFMSSNRYS